MKNSLPAYTENCWVKISGWDGVETSGMREVSSLGSFLGRLFITGTVYREDFSVAGDDDLRCALRFGVNGLLSFQGDYAGVYITHSEAILFSDRMCARKLYYSVQNGMLFAATRMDLLAEKTGCFDLRQEAAGLLIFEKAVTAPISWYKGAEALGIGEVTTYTFKTGALTRKRYDPVYGQGRTNTESVDEIGRQLAEAMEASVMGLCAHIGPERLTMNLTAGWDSRIIAAILKKNGISIPAFVIETDQGFDEIALTKIVNQYFKQPLHGVAQPAGYFAAHAEACTAAMEYTACEHIWYYEALPYAQQQNRVCMTGLIVSNLLYNHGANKEYTALNGEGTAQDRIHAYCVGQTARETLLEPEPLQALQQAYEQRLQQDLAPFLETEGGVLDWYIGARASRQILRLLDISRPWFDSVQPVCTNRVLNLVLGLSPERLGKELYEAVFRHIDEEAWKRPSSRNRPDRKLVDAIPISRFTPATLDFLAKPKCDPALLCRLYAYEKRLRATEDLKQHGHVPRSAQA